MTLRVHLIASFSYPGYIVKLISDLNIRDQGVTDTHRLYAGVNHTQGRREEVHTQWVSNNTVRVSARSSPR